MAGTLKGSVNHQITNSHADGNRDVFAIFYAFFQQLVSAEYCVEIANNWGSGGTGFDVTGGANPSGENAFAVFEFSTSTERPGGGSELGAYYVLIQWSDNALFGISPGNPGMIDNWTGDGVGICVAFAEDGSNPWGGGIIKGGGDAKSDPVWTGGATTHCIPFSNNPGGTHSAIRENTLVATDKGNTLPWYLHCLADEDNFVFLSTQNAGINFRLFVCSLYTPLDGLTTSYPLFCIRETGMPIVINTSYGSTVGSNGNEGGVMTPDNDGKVQPVKVDRYQWIMGTPVQPNTFTAGSIVFDDADIPLFSTDGVGWGWVGVSRWMRDTRDVPSEAVNAARTRAAFGTDNSSTNKQTFPWGGSEDPGASRSLAGYQF